MRFVLLAFTSTLGCGPQVSFPSDGDDESGPDDADPTSAPAGTGPKTTSVPPPPPPPPPATTGTTVASTVTQTSEDGDVSDDDGVSFIDPTDPTCGLEGPPEGTEYHCSECDTFAQDCVEGEKCMPWANDGGSAWNATRCSPIAENPGQLGEACVVEGSAVSGIDTCDIGLMCWDVDPATNEGNCEPLCAGSAENPSCPPEYSCAISGDGALALCLFDCDPLLQDCAAGQCVPFGDTFGCTPSTGDVAPGQACAFVADCAATATCLDASFLPECMDTSCCTMFCDLSSPNPDANCGPGTECVLWNDEPSPGVNNLGVCVDPSAVE